MISFLLLPPVINTIPIPIQISLFFSPRNSPTFFSINLPTLFQLHTSQWPPFPRKQYVTLHSLKYFPTLTFFRKPLPLTNRSSVSTASCPPALSFSTRSCRTASTLTAATTPCPRPPADRNPNPHSLLLASPMPPHTLLPPATAAPRPRHCPARRTL